MSAALYLCRFPNDKGPWASKYGIAFGKPPELRRKHSGISEWDYCGKIFTPSEFHSIFKGLRLKPGEGPILFEASAHKVSQE